MSEFAIVSEEQYAAEQLDDRIKGLQQLPETDPEKYAQLSQAYAERAIRDTADRRAYLESVKSKQLRKIDPHQPAFSEQAEMLRQNEVTAARIPIATSDEESEFTVEEPAEFSVDEPEESAASPPLTVTPDGPAPSFLDEVLHRKPGTPFHPGQLLDAIMQPLSGVEETATALFGEHPKKDITWTTPTTIFEGLSKDIQGLPHDLMAGLATPFNYLIAPLVGRGPTVPVIPPVVPRVLKPVELDALVAEQGLKGQVTAHPEVQPFPAKKLDTGQPLGAPSFEPGTHAESQLGQYYELDPNKSRGMTLRMRRPDLPTLQPGEFGPPHPSRYLEPSPQFPLEGYDPRQFDLTGAQGELFGGFNVRGTSPHLIGAAPLGEETQLPLGMEILRGQRLFIPDKSAKYIESYNKLILPDLQKRVLSRDMEQALKTSPLEQGHVPISVKMSPTGKSASIGPTEQEGGLVIPKDLTVANTANGAVFPSLWARVTGSALDTLRKSGSVGEGMATMIDWAYTARASATSKDMVKVADEFNTMFGARGFVARKAIGAKQLLAGENPFIYSMTRHWKITPAEEEALFNYLYTGGKQVPKDPMIKRAGDILFEHGTFPASSDPGVQSLMITDAFDPRKKYPVGKPSMFMPQQPIHQITKQAISDAHWGRLYEAAGGENIGISKDQFIKRIIAISSHDPEVTVHKMAGLENMRLLHLDALGGSPYQWAKKLGYETDPFRAVFRFNSLARLRGNLEKIKQPINGLMQSIPADQRNANEWMGAVVDRAMLNPGHYDVTRWTTNALKGVSHITDVMMLQTGGFANMMQVLYPYARGGTKASLKGFWDMLTKTDRAIVERSGSLFPAALNELTVPTGPLATWSSAAFRSYGLSLADRFTRYFAGHVGNAFIKDVERNLLKSPGNRRLAGLVRELGGDPVELLRAGGIDDDTRLLMIQRFANRTAGITDVRGVPYWATSENPWARLVNKFRTFSTANSGEIKRLVGDAPDARTVAARVSRLLIGAGVTGETAMLMGSTFKDIITGGEPRPTKDEAVKRAEALVYAMGTIEGMLLVQASRKGGQGVLAQMAGGPAIGLADSFLQDLVSTVEHGVGWRTFDTLGRRAPVVGPLIGPAISEEVKRESRREAERLSE